MRQFFLPRLALVRLCLYYWCSSWSDRGKGEPPYALLIFLVHFSSQNLARVEFLIGNKFQLSEDRVSSGLSYRAQLKVKK